MRAKVWVALKYYYELCRNGELRAEEFEEVRKYGNWAACYEIKLRREEVYGEMMQ